MGPPMCIWQLSFKLSFTEFERVNKKTGTGYKDQLLCENRTNAIDTCVWCMGMFGARFAVFVRRARVLLGPCHATRNLS